MQFKLADDQAKIVYIKFNDESAGKKMMQTDITARRKNWVPITCHDATFGLWRNQFNSCIFFFSIWVFFHDHSRITGLQGKGEGISLTPHYHFHPLHRHLDISRAITAESSPLHIASSRTRTGNLWFPSASR